MPANESSLLGKLCMGSLRLAYWMGERVFFGMKRPGAHLINPVLAKYGDEYAEPYALNRINYPADIAFVLVAMIGIAAAMHLLRVHVSEPLAHRLFLSPKNAKKQVAAGLTREQVLAIDRFCAAFWKFSSYCFMVALGVYALKDQRRWLFEPETYASIFKGNQNPPRIRQYYLIEAAYYIWGSVTLIGGLEPRLKDWWQMVTHHIATLTLIFSSYYLYLLPTRSIYFYLSACV